MNFDVQVLSGNLMDVPALARAAEEIGFRTLWMSETQHDPFLPGPLVAEHTSRLHFGTAVAISFARSPAVLAYTAWDLARASRGRFILGLGTQVKGHIERRFGMPWPDSVVGKLREQIEVMRALWQHWQTGEPLRYRGEYHRAILMTPFFNPGPIDHPGVPIFIAGVNTGLARLAGETADGFIAHPYHTPDYLSDVMLPAIKQGAEGAGRAAGDVRLYVSAFAATNETERELARQQIAFYASTPTYRSVMAHHGWSEVAEELTGLASRKKWADLPGLISDEILAKIAVIAGPEDLPGALQARYGGIADHLALYLPFIPGERDGFWRGLADGFNGG
ncbi:MAG: TIGR03617 family F420-dependent LLM class oxidoreductase [Anaerolineales bacterium]|nr:TIGR03617 family F420-dependent LLM class oxidoreductase [Anaerolineales bacterium]